MRRATARRVFGVAGSAVLALVAACGGGDDGDTLAVCSDLPYPPFEFRNDEGEFTGFDLELMREIATRLDMELEVIDQPFEGIWLAPAAGDCDIVASAMTITDEREEQALFSEPYFDADQSLMVRAEDEERFATLDDLENATIGVQTDTTGEDYARENTPAGAEVSGFPDADALFLALESGEIDAILQDFPVNAYRAQQDEAVVVTETFPTGEQYGFATSQDNQDLIDDVNEQLDAMREDGTYARIVEEWFGQAPQS
jgi:polar amino acid transport system substrate-binding protein